jgi:hypothetical protein
MLAWREIDGQVIIISPEESVMHELNETGSFLWKSLDGQRGTNELAALLAGEFDVEIEQARADTDALLSLLASRKLLQPAEQRSGGAAT